MDQDTFHYFGLLPVELRCLIYMLATPTRIVHVKKKTEDSDEFNERFNTTFKLDLHPSLTHFAFNWEEPLEGFHDTQPSLEDYGFTGGRAPYQPWEALRCHAGTPTALGGHAAGYGMGIYAEGLPL